MRRRFSPFVAIAYLIAAFCLSSGRAWAEPPVVSRHGLKFNGWMVAVAVSRAFGCHHHMCGLSYGQCNGP